MKDCYGQIIKVGDTLVPRDLHNSFGVKVLEVRDDHVVLQSNHCKDFQPPYIRTQEQLDACATASVAGKGMGGWQVKEKRP